MYKGQLLRIYNMKKKNGITFKAVMIKEDLHKFIKLQATEEGKSIAKFLEEKVGFKRK